MWRMLALVFEAFALGAGFAESACCGDLFLGGGDAHRWPAFGAPTSMHELDLGLLPSGEGPRLMEASRRRVSFDVFRVMLNWRLAA